MKTHRVPCPTRQAPAGQPCDDPAGYTHIARSDAYLRTQPRPAHARVTCYDEPAMEPEVPVKREGGKPTSIF